MAAKSPKLRDFFPDANDGEIFEPLCHVSDKEFKLRAARLYIGHLEGRMEEGRHKAIEK
jgi:hypothetical protein